MVLGNFAAFLMVLSLFGFSIAVTIYGVTIVFDPASRKQAVEAPPVRWLCEHLGLLCAVFGYGEGMRELAIIGVLLITLSLLLPRRALSAPAALLDAALSIALPISLAELGLLHWLR